MAFVKLDCGLLRSSLWVERDHRSLFVTALLMAEPFELTAPMAQLHVRSLEPTGWHVPPGWYGLVRAAGVGIVRQDGMEREAGLDALEALGAPDPESRSQEHEGRRLVRVDGGYLALNFMKYRDRDHTAGDRQKRLRARKKAAKSNGVTSAGNGVTKRDRHVTSHIAEAEADTEPKDTSKSISSPKKGGVNARLSGPPPHRPVEKPAEQPAVVPTGTTTATEPSPVVMRFMARFYGKATPERRRDIAKQSAGALLSTGVDFRGSTVRAVDSDHLDDACLQVLEEPPRDPNAAWVFVLMKLRDTYLEVLSTRNKSRETQRPAGLPPELGGNVPAGATPLRAALAGVLDGLDLPESAT